MKFSPRVFLKSSKQALAPVVFFCCCWSSADVISTLGPSGSLRGSHWSKDKSYSKDRDFLVGSLWLNLKPKEFFGTQFFFDGYIQDQNLSRRTLAYGDLREAFAEKSFKNLDIRIGRQIIVWGRGDKFNPTDSFSTKNLTLLSSDDEEQRLGQFATQLRYNFERMKLIGLWQSEWRESVFPVKPQEGIELRTLRPKNSQNQFGLKVDASGGEIDWSLSYFEGFSRTPNFRILSGSPNLQLGLDFEAIRVYGADFAKNFGDYGARGEIAYTSTQDSSGDDPLKQNSNLQAVLGVDRSIDNFNINVQALYKSVSSFVDPDTQSGSLRPLAQRLATISNQKYKDQMGVSLRPSYKMMNDTLELEVAFVSWAKNGDSLIRPKVTYAITDQFKAIAGGEFYNGPEDTFFGQLKDLSSSFAEIRYLF